MLENYKTILICKSANSIITNSNQMEILCNRDAPIKLALQINCNSTTNIFLLLTRYIKSHSRESFPQQ